MKKLENKIAVVTGAASGMGKAIAELFAQEGAKVIVVDQVGADAEIVAEGIRAKGGHAIGLKCDVSDEEQVKKMIHAAVIEFGALDILVNNAGIMDNFMPLEKVSDALWNKVLAVNLNGPFYASREAISQMLKQGKGVMIHIASVGGINGARAGLAYTTSKHALVGMSKNIGFMYAKKGIRSNVIAPGGVNTNIMKDAKPDEEGAALCSSGAGSMPRMGEPEEIAKAALFLASDDSSFVNGEVLTADGGWTAY
ncbi:NAD(P)-dependent dehydrogenase (short-subunit alcohol dehydrogenase family) [Algoriphagus boseongensis]|uniref:NAD(P)-dependent dehydrogenase (Short-subunit alcohol dehydrogenase family) n=1 Tax=Algoriphagus boseongensis TaxID=1442587 RepID=A0A4R6T369_9BACT|nr:glucose 1-dehydrogenase [Algoriphagus boseongensis]TDQ16624.1 NAD(P)-dependent dehydrogenase (short-subunit alcohol dehydrogenase family) [Algoriphagus boseongensis]